MIEVVQPSLFRELVVDCFAGAGGASVGIENAINRSPDIAINHNATAIAVHEQNHVATKHYIEDVWRVDPVKAANGMPVAFAWFSPDCTHHSVAKGGKPVSKKIRGLAWVVIRWAKRVRPRVIALENVSEFQKWGPLDENNRPIKSKSGQTFRHWLSELERLGYNIEYRELSAADYGAPTYRKRFFLIARRDGQPIIWPKPTHGAGRGLKPHRTIAECIDWSIPCPSIFERKKPLAEATCRRIARGIIRFVVNNPTPFVVPIDHRGSGDIAGSPINEPLSTVTTKNRHALVVAFMSRYFGTSTGSRCDEPAPTILANGRKDAIVCAHIAKHYGGVTGHGVDRPLGTVTTVDHHSLVTSFLVKYYGNSFAAAVDDPLDTVTTRDRFGLVMVKIAEEEYYIADIGLRMLQPSELAKAQGFDDGYNLFEIDGKPLTKQKQTFLIGNSVCPPVARAITFANVPDLRVSVKYLQ